MGIATVGDSRDGDCVVCNREILTGQIIVDDGQGCWAHEDCWRL